MCEYFVVGGFRLVALFVLNDKRLFFNYFPLLSAFFKMTAVIDINNKFRMSHKLKMANK